jgi:hypothetical protein
LCRNFTILAAVLVLCSPRWGATWTSLDEVYSNIVGAAAFVLIVTAMSFVLGTVVDRLRITRQRMRGEPLERKDGGPARAA